MNGIMIKDCRGKVRTIIVKFYLIIYDRYIIKYYAILFKIVFIDFRSKILS